ncbi:MAG: hypothetical protein DRP91_08690 [Candidatus Neomarinimicrobiota bacterium]|nr:MAG: hypothetical protein DRP91_08690 [Candidatus Neomarinimicrobiota bacterium]RKY51838.1 MAG: hypothetical protein DRP92_06715 [Candidatus Neomarinimicrobiota bacterium]
MVWTDFYKGGVSGVNYTNSMKGKENCLNSLYPALYFLKFRAFAYIIGNFKMEKLEYGKAGYLSIPIQS